MNKKPFISLVASACRPHLWEKLYESLTLDKVHVSCEFVFVGPVIPEFKLPLNFKFIKSNVKPAQCYEIAARHANGEYILFIVDDILFSKRFLDIICKKIYEINDDKAIISPIYKKNMCKRDPRTLRIDKHDSKSPIVSLIPLFNRKMWELIGGIDKRFIASMWSYDVQLRFYEAGGKLYFIKECYINEIRVPYNKNKLSEQSGIDRKTLKGFWRNKDKTYSKKRLSKVKFFRDKDILEVTQGNVGINSFWEGY